MFVLTLNLDIPVQIIVMTSLISSGNNDIKSLGKVYFIKMIHSYRKFERMFDKSF